MTGSALDSSPPGYTPAGALSPSKKTSPISVPAFPRPALGDRQAEIDREEELDEIRREIQHLNNRVDTLLSTQFLVSLVWRLRRRQRAQSENSGLQQLVTSVFCLAAVTVSTVWSRGRQFA